MYEQVLDPVGGSLFASAIFAALPLITLFVLLGGLKLKAHVAALVALAVALLVAIIAYEMPVGQGLNVALLGACFGLFPITWIVWNAVWIHNNQLKWATLTVASVLALAYVMNFSAQTLTLGQWIAGAGGVLAFLASIIGWLGVAVTGSDTSSNSLFGALQVQAAQEAGLDTTLLAAANSSGGVLGKMISPQNLAIGAAAVGLAGQEGELFRRVLGWSLALLLIMCVIVLLQSTAVLSWMVV